MRDFNTAPRRIRIAQQLGIELPERFVLDDRPWHVVVSSRLGRNLIGRHADLAVLRRFIEQAVARNDQVAIVHGTASEPWCSRAAQLLQIEPVRLFCNDGSVAASKTRHEPIWQPLQTPTSVCRDTVAIQLADRVDATFVRPGGTIFRLLEQRLASEPPGLAPSVQVAVTSYNQTVAQDLIKRGAIGYWSPIQTRAVRWMDEGDEATNPPHATKVLESLTQTPDRWLVHSTRGRSGPWPGQSLQQFYDWLLMSSPTIENSTPLDTLTHIIKQRRLIGSHQTTSCKTSVVCFSGLPLMQWLCRRAFRPHLGRWDAEPFGIAVRRDAAERLGCRPVIYGDQSTLATVSQSDRWRFQAAGKTFDWTSEHEWRCPSPVDLTDFAADEVAVFVQDPIHFSAVSESPWPVVAVSSMATHSAEDAVSNRTSSK